MSPLQRTLEWLRKHGYEATKTEHWNHFAKRRQDLFGFIDVLAVNETHVLAIQCSDDSHHAGHRAKIMASVAAHLLAYHMEIEIWSWGLKLTGQKRLDGKLHREKVQTLRRDSLTERLLSDTSRHAVRTLQTQLGLRYEKPRRLIGKRPIRP